MKPKALIIAGLVLSVFGSLAVAETGSEANPPEKKKGQKPDKEMNDSRPGREAVLERFDTDGDGTLNEAEREALNDAMQKHRHRPGGPHGRRPGREEILERFDADGDGALSESERLEMRTERERMRREHMERFDTDGDGKLSGEERKTMHETLRVERPEPHTEDNS
jgi:hypothetical protein